MSNQHQKGADSATPTPDFKDHARKIAVFAEWGIFGARLVLGITSFILVYSDAAAYLMVSHGFSEFWANNIAIVLGLLLAVVIDGGLAYTLPYATMIVLGIKVEMQSNNRRMRRVFNVIVFVLVAMQLTTTGALSLLFSPRAAEAITEQTDTSNDEQRELRYLDSYESDKVNLQETILRKEQQLADAQFEKEQEMKFYAQRRDDRLRKAANAMGAEMYNLYKSGNGWAADELRPYLDKAVRENAKDSTMTVETALTAITAAKAALSSAEDNHLAYINNHSTAKDTITKTTTLLVAAARGKDQQKRSANQLVVTIIMLACIAALIVLTFVKVIYESETGDKVAEEQDMGTVLTKGFHNLRRYVVETLDAIFDMPIPVLNLSLVHNAWGGWRTRRATSTQQSRARAGSDSTARADTNAHKESGECKSGKCPPKYIVHVKQNGDHVQYSRGQVNGRVTDYRARLDKAMQKPAHARTTEENTRIRHLQKTLEYWNSRLAEFNV